MATTISKFANIHDTTNPKDIDLDVFLDYIQEGFWQDHVIPIRLIEGKKERTNAKKKLPYVLLSGKFGNRSIGGLLKHSNYLALDLDEDDNPNILNKRDTLYGDRYVHSGWITTSGKGLCLLIKIDGSKHLDAFMGAEEYFFKNYDVIIDTSCKDVSRARYVSYDPDLYRAERCEKFTLYPKEKAPKKVDNIVFAKNDFESLIKDISSKGLNIVDSYHDWMRTGFAFAEKFGEAGRQYFHVISSISAKYNSRQTDRQYNHCIRKLGSGLKIATIAVFYYLCKSAGLSIYSERTKTIINASVQAKKGGRTPDQVASVLEEFEGIKEAEEIINQVFNSNIESVGEDSLISQILLYLKHNHSFRKNSITRFLEDSGVTQETEDINSLFLDIKQIYDKTSFELVERILHSNNTPMYNPVKEYLENIKTAKTGLIDALADSILSEDHEFTRYFFKKWFVSIIASIYGDHSPLMFILSGPVHGMGKTEFFRRLWPAPLKPYYAETVPGMKDTDFYLLMTQKICIMDDEVANKSKKEDDAQKAMLSKQEITVREPYGRKNITLPRLSTFGGTSNEEGLISDTDNRRYIVVYYFSHDFNKYNAIDKEELFGEAYNLYRSGYNYHLTMDDKEYLKKNMGRFQKFTSEYELLVKYFRKPNKGEENYLSATEIKNHLETKSVQKIVGVDKVGKELKRLGYECLIKKINGSAKRCYNIIEVDYNKPYNGDNEIRPEDIDF